jgi:Fe-S-cluster-containing hydrogenase component 2
LRRILVDRDPTSASACSGCRACEVACVAHHEGRFGTAAARIHVVKVEPLGIDQPHVCRQCGAGKAAARAPCVAACPMGALYRDEHTGAILVNADPASSSACIGCSACVDACPFGVATLHSETGTAIICDLCGGDPACVVRCATGAIVYAEGDAGARERREALTLASVASASLRAEERHGDATPTDNRRGSGAESSEPVAGASLCAEEWHGDAAATDIGRRDADV